MADINKLMEEIGNLTMQEAADMGKLMETKWGINYDAILNAGSAPAAPVEGAKKDVWLKGFPADKKILVLKAIKSVLGLGLMEAKNFVEAAPKLIEGEVEEERLNAIKQEIESAGGEIQVK